MVVNELPPPFGNWARQVSVRAIAMGRGGTGGGRARNSVENHGIDRVGGGEEGSGEVSSSSKAARGAWQTYNGAHNTIVNSIVIIDKSAKSVLDDPSSGGCFGHLPNRGRLHLNPARQKDMSVLNLSHSNGQPVTTRAQNNSKEAEGMNIYNNE